jgi:nickel-dependent lactate racemase
LKEGQKMALKRYSFGYGHGTQEIDLPEEKVLQVINGNPSTKIDDVKAATLEAIRNPIGTEPLQKIVEKGDKVAIIVSDITRTLDQDK